MIFSQWQSDGGYAYFDSDVRHPIGDDIPAALPPEINDIGVPSHDVGVPLPRGAKRIGEGDSPRGIMTPMSRDGYKTLSGTGAPKDKTAMLLVAFAVMGVFLVAGLSGRGRR